MSPCIFDLATKHAANMSARLHISTRRHRPPGPGIELAFALSWVLLGSDAASATGIGRGMDQYSFSSDDRMVAADRFPPWSDMMGRRAREAFSLEGCISSALSCTPSMRGARTVVLRGRPLPLAEQLQLVNRFVNRRRYAEQSLGTQWETPATFLKEGGDCEDYAVVKYFLLRAMGVAAEDLRIVVGRTRHHAAYHALLAARVADRVLLLDTDDRLLPGDRRSDYLYLYSINELSLWDHAGHSMSAER